MSKSEYPRVGLMTDAGLVRGRPLDTVLSLDLSYGQLLVLADGAGAGESPTAAEIAVDTLSEVFQSKQPDFSTDRAVPRFIQFALQEANQRVFMAGQQIASPTEFSASLVLTLVVGDDAYVGYCGSARMVLLRNGQATRITKDYSTVGPGEAAEGKSTASKIAKPMGLSAQFSPSVFAGPIKLHKGDLFLLCSDGIHEWVDDSEMGHYAESAQAEEAAVQLVQLAKKRGSSESISIVVFQTDSPVVEATDDTEGVVIMAEPDQSPTEPAQAAPLPPPPKRREDSPIPAPKARRPVPWLVVTAAFCALVLLAAVLVWSPWSTEESTDKADGKTVAQKEEPKEVEDSPDPEAEEDEATQEKPALADDDRDETIAALANRKKAQPEEEQGKVIEIALPVPNKKEKAKVPDYVEETKPAAHAGKAPVVVKGGLARAEEKPGEETPEEKPVAEAKLAPAQVDDEEPESPAEPAEVAKAETKKTEEKVLSAAERKKLEKEERRKARAERKAAEKAEKEAKKAEAKRKKDEERAARKAELEAKKAEAAAKRAQAEAAKAEVEAAKAAAKKAEEEAKKAELEAKQAAELRKQNETKAASKKHSELGCTAKGLRGKDARAVEKTLKLVTTGKAHVKKSDGQEAVADYRAAAWQVRNNKTVKARCESKVDELRADVMALYLRLTEYQVGRKNCRSARGRAKDASEFGATDAQLKKALGICYVKGGTSSGEKIPSTPSSKVELPDENEP